MDKILDLALLSDILPTAFHGLMEAGAKPGSTVYIAGAGPVGRCGAAAARLLGASCIIVADYDRESGWECGPPDALSSSEAPLPGVRTVSSRSAPPPGRAR